jgi:hypothetical protein
MNNVFRLGILYFIMCNLPIANAIAQDSVAIKNRDSRNFQWSIGIAAGINNIDAQFDSVDFAQPTVLTDRDITAEIAENVPIETNFLTILSRIRVFEFIELYGGIGTISTSSDLGVSLVNENGNSFSVVRDRSSSGNSYSLGAAIYLPLSLAGQQLITRFSASLVKTELDDIDINAETIVYGMKVIAPNFFDNNWTPFIGLNHIELEREISTTINLLSDPIKVDIEQSAKHPWQLETGAQYQFSKSISLLGSVRSDLNGNLSFTGGASWTF